jgi:hypothetical protein
MCLKRHFCNDLFQKPRFSANLPGFAAVLRLYRAAVRGWSLRDRAALPVRSSDSEAGPRTRGTVPSERKTHALEETSQTRPVKRRATGGSNWYNLGMAVRR